MANTDQTSSGSSPSGPPLSPHLQVWKWHPTMASSIFHRATGVANYVGAFFVTLWLLALGAGPEAYAAVEMVFLSPVGRLILFGFTLSVIYHLLNGLRHMLWDAGTGFDPQFANIMSVVIIASSVVLTVGVWFAAYSL